MANYLHVGDVIKIEKGMRIYIELPTNLFTSNSPFDSKIRRTAVTVGDVLKKNAVSKESLYETVFEHIKTDIPVSREKVIELIDSLELNYDEESFDTSCLVGEYEVISARYPDEPHMTYYPEGWYVCCKKIDDGTNISFRQDGAFSAVIPDIEVIKHL